MRKQRLILWILAVSLLFCACSRGQKRDVSTLGKALLGHWVTHSGGMRVDYYFGDGTFVLKIRDSRLDWSYSVLESNEKNNSLVVEIDMGFMDEAGYKVPTGMVLKFSRDRNSITETSVGPEGKITNKWQYVDSRTEPEDTSEPSSE